MTKRKPGKPVDVVKYLSDVAVDHDALERAQDLAWDAMGAKTTARGVLLAKKSLAISPFCADAYMLLAESEPPASEERLRLYEIGAAAGQRAIEADFDTMVGEFWGFLETRSYMRARHGLALTLWDRGQHERAIEHYVGMLVLNPNDNQGIRYLLLAAYLEIGADAKARKLLKRYKNDGMADWSYGAALVAFREVGDAEVSRKALAKAIKANSRVVGYFTGKRKLPRSLPLYVSPGGDDEAIACCHLLKGAWSMTNGALEWLRSAASSS